MIPFELRLNYLFLWLTTFLLTFKMQKFFILLFLLFFSSELCFSQVKSNPVVVNRQVEVVEYDYDYIFMEFFSGVSCSSYYPILSLGQISNSQSFFEEGRNIRPGFDVGFSHGVKVGRWALNTGIFFQRYTEFFSYSEYETRNVILQNEDGSEQITTVAVGEPISFTRNNNLHYLKIPLALSYFPKRFNNLIGFSVEANYQYLLSADYMTKHSVLKPASLLLINDFNRTVLSLSGCVLINWTIRKNLSLTIEPYFGWGIKNVIDRPDLTFGINTIGLRTGFSYSY